jgi:hypothetical protein
LRRDNAIPVRLTLFAILHVCLGARHLRTFGRYEPLYDLFPVAAHLEHVGDLANAKLTLAILAFLWKHTLFLTAKECGERVVELPDSLRRICRDNHRRVSHFPDEALWSFGDDPWNYLMSGYELARTPEDMASV